MEYRDKTGKLIPDDAFENEPTPTGLAALKGEALRRFDAETERLRELRSGAKKLVGNPAAPAVTPSAARGDTL